jgi:hypothetical protein
MTAYADALSALSAAVSAFHDGSGDAEGMASAAEAALDLLSRARGATLPDGGNVVDHVLRQAASVLWFADSSDYKPALWCVARDLDPALDEACRRTLPAPLRNLSDAEELACRRYLDDALRRRLSELDPGVFEPGEPRPVEPPSIGRTLHDALQERAG